MMRKRVLVSAPYMQPVLHEFADRFERHDIDPIVPTVNERLSEEELLPLVGDIDGMVCGDDKITAKVLAQAPRLRVIVKWGTGIDSIDTEACSRRGISVLNTPGAFTRPVTETVFGAILCFTRNLITTDRSIRDGNWEKTPGLTLAEATLGIVGVGHVGKEVARMAHRFGMKVLGTDIVEMPSAFLAETGISMVTLDEVLGGSDIVTLHCDLNRTSYHLISRRELSLMRPSTYLINTARGPVIDEPALVDALKARQIAGATLDVYEDEPLPPDSPLREFDTVLLGSHNANSSPAAWQATHESTLRQLFAVLTKDQHS
jgi:D-3-phosphoglycerate dehydrogenase